MSTRIEQIRPLAEREPQTAELPGHPPRPKAALFDLLVVFTPLLLSAAYLLVVSIESPVTFVAIAWPLNFCTMLLIACRIRSRNISWRELGCGWGRWNMRTAALGSLQSLIVLFLAMLGFVVAGAAVMVFIDPQAAPDMSQYNYLSGNLSLFFVSLAGVLVVSSFGEELIYRSFLINRLEALLGGASTLATSTSVACSSLWFGLIHFHWGWVGVVQTTGMGLALGLSFILLKRNLWPLVAAHATMDTLLLLQLYLAR